MPTGLVVAVEVFFGLLIGAVALYFFSVLVYLPLTGQSAFIPTYRSCVDHILREAPIEPGVRFADLGAGDGRVLVAAERLYGVDAVGYEFNPVAYAVCRLHLWLFGSRARLVFANFHKVDLSGYDVVYCYLTPFVQEKLFPKFQTNLKPGALIISRIYTVGDWRPFRTLQYTGPNGDEATYLYRAPGREVA